MDSSLVVYFGLIDASTEGVSEVVKVSGDVVRTGHFHVVGLIVIP